jgi:hypothetical protein
LIAGQVRLRARFAPKTSYQYLGTGPGYAQNSSADYFAHTFTAAIINHPSIPNMSVQFWMAALIDLTK